MAIAKGGYMDLGRVSSDESFECSINLQDECSVISWRDGIMRGKSVKPPEPFFVLVHDT